MSGLNNTEDGVTINRDGKDGGSDGEGLAQEKCQEFSLGHVTLESWGRGEWCGKEPLMTRKGNPRV